MALHTISSRADTRWEIDPDQTTVRFAVGRPVPHRVNGQFHNIRGSVTTTGGAIDGAAIDVEIDAASIGTGISLRDQHLRDRHFLDVARFPSISFVSTGVEEQGSDDIRVLGDLTIRGITHPIALAVSIRRRDDQEAEVEARTTFNARRFQVGPKLMPITIGSKVAVEIALTLRAG